METLTAALAGASNSGRRCLRHEPVDVERGRRVGNALLVKLNQIGTVTETLDAMHMAARQVTSRSFPPIR
jgi:hypothetical protein